MTDDTRKQEAGKSQPTPSDNVPAGGNSKSEKVDTPSTEAKQQELLAGKYKSVEELEKAYKEAEKKLHEKTAKEKEEDYGSLFEEATPKVPSYPSTPYDPNYGYPDQQKELKDKIFKVDIYTQVKRATDKEFAKNEAEAIAYVKKTPSLLRLLREGDMSVIDHAYKVIKSEKDMARLEEEKKMAAEKARKEIENIEATNPKSIDDKQTTPPPPPPSNFAGDVIDAAADGSLGDLASNYLADLEEKALKRKK